MMRFEFRRARRYAVATWGTLLLGACSSTLTTLQPARLVPPKHVQAVASVQGTVPVGVAGDVVDDLRALDDLGRQLDPQETEEVAQIAATALVQPPSIDGQLALAYGVNKRLELDGRVGATSAGFGFRVQFLRKRPGIYGAIGMGANFGFNGFAADRFTDRASIGRFRRRELAFPLVLGFSNRYVHVWAGPKLLFSWFDIGVDVCIDRDASSCRGDTRISTSGQAHYFAGQFGIAVGRRRVWVATELTLARLRATGDLEGEPGSGVERTNFRRVGRVLTPALGLIVWF